MLKYWKKGKLVVKQFANPFKAQEFALFHGLTRYEIDGILYLDI